MGFGTNNYNKTEFFRLNGKECTLQRNYKVGEQWQSESIGYISGILKGIERVERKIKDTPKMMYVITLQDVDEKSDEVTDYKIETSEGAMHTNSILNALCSLEEIEPCIYLSAYKNKANDKMAIYLSKNDKNGERISWKWQNDQLPPTPEVKDAQGRTIMVEGRPLLDNSERNAFFINAIEKHYPVLFGRHWTQQPTAQQQQTQQPAQPAAATFESLIGKLVSEADNSEFMVKMTKLLAWAYKNTNARINEKQQDLVVAAMADRLSGITDKIACAGFYKTCTSLLKEMALPTTFQQNEMFRQGLDVAGSLMRPAQVIQDLTVSGVTFKDDDLPF